MKKFLIIICAACLLMTGCGNNSTPKTESPSPKQAEHPASTPKELTPEEKAAKESERQAAEEKRRQEKSDLEAKQREQALAKTLQVTPYEFVQRFNDSTYDLGVGGLFNIGEPQIQNGSVQDAARYIFNDRLAMLEAINKETGNIQELTVLVSPSQNVEQFRADLMSTIAIYSAAVKATNPNLTIEDVATIQEKLGLNKPITEWVNDSSTIYDGRKYVKQLIKGVGFSFIISTP